MIGGRLGRPILLLTQEADRIGRDPKATMFPRVTGSREVAQLSAALRSLLRRVGDAEQRMVESERQRAIEGRRYSADVDQLRRLADTDPLSGLLNRRSFERNAVEAMEHFRRNGRPFAVLVLDIDHFKRVNDTYGHSAGDEVIQHVANILAHQIRVPDRIARVGGEEFLALVHEVRADDALALAERLRSEVEGAYVCRDKEIIKVTVSIGLSVALESDRDIEDVVARADVGLYEAKAKGRNRSIFRAAYNVAESEARAA
jgi:diguanylate cyclase (GGDEF)-like protein